MALTHGLFYAYSSRALDALFCFYFFLVKKMLRNNSQGLGFPGGLVVKTPPASAGARVLCLVRKDPTCCRATEAHAPESRCPTREASTMRSPPHPGVAPASANRESPHSHRGLVEPKNKQTRKGNAVVTPLIQSLKQATETALQR